MEAKKSRAAKAAEVGRSVLYTVIHETNMDSSVIVACLYHEGQLAPCSLSFLSSLIVKHYRLMRG